LSSSDSTRAALRGRPLRLLLVLALLLGAGAVVGLLLREGRAGPRGVLLVSVDTLAARVVDPEDTPAMMDLAARGLRFTRVRTAVPLTLPSHLTILSGLDPVAHGVRDNTAPPLGERGERGWDLLAEQFADAGWATAAFVASSVLDPRYRLDAGFDLYRRPPAVRPGAPGFESLDAEEQVARFRAWYEARPRDRRWFAFVHLWEPHAPYRAWAGDARRAGTDADLDPPEELYRGEVRRADAAIERLLALVDPATTLVIVTSDHGEALGAHGESTHGYLCYGETMDVPLILAGPGVPPAPPDDRLASLVDVAPTLRRLCGLPARAGGGRDLLRPAEGPRVVVGESLYAWRAYGWAQQLCATDGRFSLVDGGPVWGLHDLRSDPGETTPLADAQGHAAYEILDRALADYRARDARGAGGSADWAPYASPYGSLRREGRALLDPATNRQLPAAAPRLSTLELLDRARQLVAVRQAEALQSLLPELEARERDDPRNPAWPMVRGRALYFVLDRPAEAVEALERAVDLGYDARPALELLAEACRRAGDAERLARVEARLGR